MGDCAEGFRIALAKPAQANLLVYVDTPTLECWAVKTEKMLNRKKNSRGHGRGGIFEYRNYAFE